MGHAKHVELDKWKTPNKTLRAYFNKCGLLWNTWTAAWCLILLPSLARSIFGPSSVANEDSKAASAFTVRDASLFFASWMRLSTLAVFDRYQSPIVSLWDTQNSVSQITRKCWILKALVKMRLLNNLATANECQSLQAFPPWDAAFKRPLRRKAHQNPKAALTRTEHDYISNLCLGYDI